MNFPFSSFLVGLKLIDMALYKGFKPNCTSMYEFLGHECSDLGVGGWVRTNSNVVLCKSYELLDDPL